MDSKRCSICFIMIMYFCSMSFVNCQTNNIFNVSDYGAISSGKLTDNKLSFLNAWKKACESPNGVFLIPAGTYYLSDAAFDGPCKGRTTVTINGLVTAFPQTTSDFWIRFTNITGLTVDGTGTLDGNGAESWSGTCTSCKRPDALYLENVFNAHFSNIKLVNSKLFHMNIHESGHVTINHLTVRAPGNSTNTDGVHIARSTDIRVLNSAIATGDDCVSIGEGSSNVNITGVFCGPGHGLSIGSLGRYSGEQDVSRITVTNSTLTNTLNGVRIKTLANSPSSSTVQNVTFEHIILNNVDNPIIIDQHYCPTRINCPKGESSVELKSVKFIDVRGSSTNSVAVKLDCSGSRPCQDIELSGVNIKFKGQPTTATCSKANPKFIGSNQIPSKCS